MRRWATAALLLSAPTQAIPQTPPPVAEAWFELVGPKGQLVGFQHEWVRAGPDGSEQGQLRSLAYHVDGHVATRSSASLIRRYDKAGDLLSFDAGFVAPHTHARTSGRVAGDRLQLEGEIDGKRRSKVVALPPGLLLGEPLLMQPVAGRYAEIVPGSLTLIPVEVAEAIVPNARGRSLRISRSNDRLLAAEVLERDTGGETTGTILPQLGYDLTLRRVSGPVDLAALSAARELPHEMMPSPFFIRSHALAGQIRYSFGWRFGFSATLPETGEQRVIAKAGTWQVDICAECGPVSVPSEGQLEQWRKPSRWIESDAPEFRSAVRRVRSESGRARMAALARFARSQLSEMDFEGHVSARTAWRRGAGDCTEDAVVLAALARAAGIPARVANGIVYSRQRYHGAANAFLSHSWVLAWVDGRWRSFDISLEGFDASHIALSLGDGEPESIIESNRLAALLDWKSMGEVRRD